MRKILFAVPFLLIVWAVPSIRAEEVTLKGKVTCAKCDLGTSDKCQTVVVVKADGKDVVYTFDAAGETAHHKEICKKGKEGSVTGVVSTEGDKHMIKVSKVEYTP